VVIVIAIAGARADISDQPASRRALGFGSLVGIYELSCDNGALILHLKRSAVHRLELLVHEPASDRLEAGGILIGTVAPDNSIVTLLDVIPVESEHRFGPAFRPSESDLRVFRETIAECSSGPHCVIGYFRSHIQESLSLRVADEYLLQSVFGGDGCSIILVHFDLAGQSTAVFCQWDGADVVRILERIPLIAKPVIGQPLYKSNRLGFRAAPEPGGGPCVEGTAAPGSRESRAAEAHSPRRRFRKTAMAAVVAIVMGAAFGLSRLMVPQKPAAIPVHLELTVELHDSVVDVKWNPRSPLVSDSERGALDFVDGPGVRRIDLNQAQLRTGHYQYVSRNADLTCLMTVYRDHNILVAEERSVHVNPGRTPSLLAERLAAPQASDEQPAAKHTPEQATARVQGQGDETMRIVMSQQQRPDGEPQARLRAVTFTPPPAGVRTVSEPRLENPPQLGQAVSDPAVLAVAVSPIAAPPVVAQPVADDPPLTFSAAAPIARVSPVVSPATRSAIRESVSIRVAIQVDPEGKVTGARPVDATDPIEKLLAQPAVQAARLWRFDPARRNGAPVASETVVVFQFARN
jgi:hypothetical protein